MPDPLKVVAIKQPYAWAVCSGVKRVENRTWKTPHRGLVVVSASASKQWVQAMTKEPGGETLAELDLVYGALIGAVEIVDCIPYGPELAQDPWAVGPWCWTLANARLFAEPIPYKAKVNIYALPEDVAKKAHEQLSMPAPEVDLTTARRALAIALGEPHHLWLDRADGAIALNHAEVLQHCAAALGEIAPDTPEPVFFAGVAKLFAGDNENAVRMLSACIEQHPDFARAYKIRAIAYENLADADHAKAEELDPSLAEDAAADGDIEGE